MRYATLDHEPRSSMPAADRRQLARDLYRAFNEGDRDAAERILADDLRFSSPLDVGLDRAGYFERCWPGAGQHWEMEFVRLIESGDEVIVTYETTKPDGSRGRNTEILTFDGDRVAKVEVYFGWDVS
jgi:predicted SnoaL-like aldol condensation-catalyzing enzyme